MKAGRDNCQIVSLRLVRANLFRKKFSFVHSGGGFHPRLVPYQQLTDKEKQKDLKFYQDLVKYLNTFGYRVVK